MKTLRTTIYLKGDAVPALGPLDKNVSGRISTALVRHVEACRQHCPALTMDQWKTICDAMERASKTTDAVEGDPIRMIWMLVFVTDQALGEKLRDMPYIEQCAVMEIVTRFWSWPECNGVTKDEAIRRAGAVVATG